MVTIKSWCTNKIWFCRRESCLTPSWRAPWSPGCGRWGSTALTSQWGTEFGDPWSAPGRTLWTTAGTDRSTAAGPLNSGRTQEGIRKWRNVYSSTDTSYHFHKRGFHMIYSPLKLSRCVKKKECLWKSSMATTIGPSKLLRRVFFDPLLSAISDSSMVRTMYSCTGKAKVRRYKLKIILLYCHFPFTPCM